MLDTLLWILLGLAIVSIVLRLVRGPRYGRRYRGGYGGGMGNGGVGGRQQQSALEVLKARYAKGEITKDQFDQMKSDIGGQ